ncbi:MAG: hypothetical protein LKF31_06640 [Muribaculaceae bacterium]|jgi:RNA polymerase sigma factor (sigma-70 family)|nr:hypothetical protein [Muribaculaceae bacterium]
MNDFIQEQIRKLNPIYQHKTDDEILDDIFNGLNSGNALFYLLFSKLNPMFISIFNKLSKGNYTNNNFSFSYDDALDDILCDFELKLSEKNYATLRSFNNQAKFSTWIYKVAENFFIDDIKRFRRQYSEIPEDKDDDENLLDGEEDELISIMKEAIEQLDNPDFTFIFKKELEGFSAPEIAELLAEEWKANGTAHIRGGVEIVPTVGYIYTLKSRGLRDIARKMRELAPRPNYVYSSRFKIGSSFMSTNNLLCNIRIPHSDADSDLISALSAQLNPSDEANETHRRYLNLLHEIIRFGSD